MYSCYNFTYDHKLSLKFEKTDIFQNTHIYYSFRFHNIDYSYIENVPCLYYLI